METKGVFIKMDDQAVGKYFVIQSQDVPGDNDVYSEIYDVNIKDTSLKKARPLTN
jgi:hypothetical protein